MPSARGVTSGSVAEAIGAGSNSSMPSAITSIMGVDARSLSSGSTVLSGDEIPLVARALCLSYLWDVTREE